MGKDRRYDQEYKDMIVELFKSGMSLAELSSEYGIAKSTINGWIKDLKEIKKIVKVPVGVISLRDYGLLDGSSIIKQAKQLIQK